MAPSTPPTLLDLTRGPGRRLRGALVRPGLAAINELRTPRLRLRQWRDADLEPFAQLNADPDVMRCFPAPLSRQESDVLAARHRAGLAERGYGVWAVEVVDGPAFVGAVGLSQPALPGQPADAVQIGWRFGRTHWGRGYATEAARAALAFGFDWIALDEIVAATALLNDRSRAVMERLAMTHDPSDDFDHPLHAPGGPLRRHVLYSRRHPAHLRGPASVLGEPRFVSRPPSASRRVPIRPSASTG